MILNRHYIAGKCSITNGLESCAPSEKDIQDWDFYPRHIFFDWMEGEDYPPEKVLFMNFPELHLLPQYQQVYDTIVYKMEADPTPFYDISHNVPDENNVVMPAENPVQIHITFKNLEDLPYGSNSGALYFRCFGKKGNTEVLLEAKSVGVCLYKKETTDEKYIYSDKPVYDVFFNKQDGNFFGDTFMRLLQSNFTVYEADYYHFTTELQDGQSHDNYILFTDQKQESSGNFHYHWSQKMEKGSALESGFESLEVGVIALRYKFHLMNYSGYGDAEFFSDEFVIQLHVINEPFFQIIPNEFNVVLPVNSDNFFLNEVTIAGTDGLVYNMISSPEIEDCLLTPGNPAQLQFSTKTAQELGLGIHKAYVMLSAQTPESGTITRVLVVNISVENYLKHNFESINFCKDEHFIHLFASEKSSKKALLKMILTINAYQISETIEREYENVFFNHECTFYPGEDVQDFFPKISDFKPVDFSQGSEIAFRTIFEAVKVNFIVKEIGVSGNVVKTYNIDNINFFPGEKPTGYPFLTNSPLRSTITNSLISVSALGFEYQNKVLSQIAGSAGGLLQIPNDNSVCNLIFRRSRSDETYGSQNIISVEGLALEPKAHVHESFDVIFMNQNYCPEWMTFTEDKTPETYLNDHLVTEKIQNGERLKVEKAHTKTLRFNTGWLFEEELPVLEELMRSPIAFVYYKRNWQKVLPISKKINPKDKKTGLYQHSVEFEVVETYKKKSGINNVISYEEHNGQVRWKL